MNALERVRPILTSVDNFDQVWTNLKKFDQVWTSLDIQDQFGQIYVDHFLDKFKTIEVNWTEMISKMVL